MSTEAGWYIGAGVSVSKISAGSFGGLNNASDKFETGSGISLTGGYRFHKTFALELGYVDGGATAYRGTASLFCINGQPCAVDIEQKTNYASVTAVGIFPIAEKWEVFGEAGAVFWNAQSAQSIFSLGESTPTKVDISLDGTDILLGLGLGVMVGEKAHLRLAYTFFDTDSELIGLDKGTGFESFSLELHWRF